MPQFEAIPEEKRARIRELIKAGKSVKDVSEDTGVSTATVYKERKRIGAPETIAPPPIRPDKSATGTTTESRPRAAGHKFTKDAAEKLVAGVFSIVAIFFGPIWALEAHEKKELGSALADISDALPASATATMGKWVAPGIFLGVLGAIVKRRVDAIAEWQAQQAHAAGAADPLIAANRATPSAPSAPPPPPPSGAYAQTPAEQVAADRLRNRNGTTEHPLIH